ncbi:hypothetical protein PO124_07680 [Bacillus licheniformis]|nr:hypothetical protein [Bacillus licheniformis]
MNAHPEFGSTVAEEISALTGQTFKARLISFMR